jgi:hypothetical protein
MNDERSGADMVVRQEVGLDLRLAMLAGVREEAEARGVAMGAAVVDLGGQVVAALRMDGAQLPALNLAIDKAYTAVSFGHPTEFWAASTRPDGSDWGLASTLGRPDRRLRGRAADPRGRARSPAASGSAARRARSTARAPRRGCARRAWRSRTERCRAESPG